MTRNQETESKEFQLKNWHLKKNDWDQKSGSKKVNKKK